MDTQAANWIWLPTQPRHYTTREKVPLSRQLLKMGTMWPETCWATYKEQIIRRNKYNTKWHLVGFLFHIEIRPLTRWRKSQTHVVIFLLKDANNISLQVTSNFCMIIIKCKPCGQKAVVAYLRTYKVIILSDQYLCKTSLSYSKAREGRRWVGQGSYDNYRTSGNGKEYWSDKIMSFRSNFLVRCEERPLL